MRRTTFARGHVWFGAFAFLVGCLLLTSCQSLEPSREYDPEDEDCCNNKAKVCTTPTVQALAQDLDSLERHIDKFGSVVAQHPDVWGQSRMTRHREDFEEQMYAEIGNFKLTLQGSLSRSDQTYLSDSFALSSAAAAAAQGGKSGSAAAVVSNTSATTPSGGTFTNATTIPVPSGSSTSSSSGGGSSPSSGSGGSGAGGSNSSGSSGGSTASGSDAFAAFGSITRTPVGTVTGASYSFLQGNSSINVEPEVYLAQKARYLNYLNELRRVNEGDDTADSPGYALNLIRIPVSVLPGKCTEIGHGAEITMTLTPHLSEELLPTTFRSLIQNDLVDQIAYPVAQFINNPENAVYLDDRKSGTSGALTEDVKALFAFVDEDFGPMLDRMEQILFLSPLDIPFPLDRDTLHRYMVTKLEENSRKLRTLRWKLTLQPLFLRPEWQWVDDVLNTERLIAEYEAIPAHSAGPNIRSSESSPMSPALEQGRGPTGDGKAPAAKDGKTNPLVDRTPIGALKSAPSVISGLALQQVLVPSTKSRRATLPFPPTQMTEVYGFDFTFSIALDAYRGLLRERFSHPCPDSNEIYIHLPDIQGYLQEELNGVYKLLSNPDNCYLWHKHCTEELAKAVRSRQADKIAYLREEFTIDIWKITSKKPEKGKSAASDGTKTTSTMSEETEGFPPPEPTVALAWAMIVESALLNQQLVQDMRESAAAKGCPCAHEGWLPYFLPDPPQEARDAFNEYVRCRWPIHVFALDPTMQQQNISDVYSGRRELQLAMSLAFVSGNLSASNMMRFARRLEFDAATINLNNTDVGFSHGDETFGWRFYPRFQTPEIESNAVVVFRDLLWGGPGRDALLRQRRLEPGQRECVAVVIMPSFVPYADLSVSSNWFKLDNPKCKVMDSEFAMRLSKAVKTIEKCGPKVQDANCYRDGDFELLLQKGKQLSERLPLQSAAVQIPFENTLGGFGMFNTGVTDLAPELNGWYGSPSINPNAWTTIFLFGNHFSVHQTRVIASGNEIPYPYKELLSRQVMKVMVPPNPNLLGQGQKFIDIQLATPYGVSEHLLVPVCVPLCAPPCPPQPTQPATATSNTPMLITGPYAGPVPPVAGSASTSTSGSVAAGGNTPASASITVQPSTPSNAQAPASGTTQTSPSTSASAPASGGTPAAASGSSQPAGSQTPPASGTNNKTSSSATPSAMPLSSSATNPLPPMVARTSFTTGGFSSGNNPALTPSVSPALPDKSKTGDAKLPPLVSQPPVPPLVPPKDQASNPPSGAHFSVQRDAYGNLTIQRQ
jgi:hypothetical protein